MKRMKTICVLFITILLGLMILTACGKSGEDGDEEKTNRTKKKPASKKGYEVGEDIGEDDISDFYYTYGSIEFDMEYLRYRFYEEDGKRLFYHESRESQDREPGNLSDDDITGIGTVELTDEQWEEFFDLISGGTVTKRVESADSGDKGPWMFLYWTDDRGKYQVYDFESYARQKEFLEFCASLEGGDSGKETAGDNSKGRRLLEFSYSPGYSDMGGAYHNACLSCDTSGVWTIVEEDREWINGPETVTVYAVSKEDAEKFISFLWNHDILSLTEREDSDMFITDYSPWSYSIYVDESMAGGKAHEYYTIGELKRYSDEDYKLLKELGNMFSAIHGEILSQETRNEEDPEEDTDEDTEETMTDHTQEPFELKNEWLDDQMYTLADPAPESSEELKKQVDVHDPRSVAAYWVWAVNRLTEDYDDGMAMMKYLFADIEPYGRGYTEGGVSGKAGWDSYFNERLKDSNYSWLPRAYFEGDSTRAEKFALKTPLSLKLYYNETNTKTLNDQSLDALGRLNIVYWVQSRAAGNQVNINLSRFEGSDRWYVTSGTSSSALFYMQ